MNCGSCGSPNREGRRFCGKCGAPLARTCPGCGTANDADENFCGQCGVELAAAPASDRPGVARLVPAALGEGENAPTAERRHVTVLFADLVGFTTFSDHRDAEDVRELLSRYFELARTVIVRYGGSVEKFIGDAVMAVWGAQATQENDAERAVRAALELVESVAVLGDEAGATGLRARAGVLTGEAVVTLGAVGHGMVAGDLVNTASRVQSSADPGSVFVGDATRQVTEAAIVYEDTGTHQLKGKAEPVRLWRAQRVAAGRGGAMRASGLEPPFVGRDRELRLLKEYLHGTGEEGKARLLSIVGIGGVGKSRLGWEFFKYVDGLSEVVAWHRGRCLAYGEGVAHWALNEMVRMRAGILENEAPDSARLKLRASVEEYVTDPEERRWVEPRLAHLVGLEERVATDPRDLYAAWRFFFERIAEKNLTVLLFEDLQWADSGLLDFIEYLLEWSRSSPLLVVTLARPELTEKRPGWAAGRRGVTSLYLEPLSPDAMDRLLEGMVPGLPDDLKARIGERAAGVPLYAVETVRMLLDRGLLVEDGGTYRAEGSLEALEVPESLHALIAARLDSLLPDERQLLQDASVVGKSFTSGALRAITVAPQDAVAPGLSSLVTKDLLAIQSDPRSPERGQYIFLQDLVRNVAYGTLARRDRKLRHLAMAAYLEGGWNDEEEVAEVVAAHLVEAYDAERDAPEAEQIRVRARDALVKAGDHAASLAAATSAQHYYERALQLAEDADRAELLARAGNMAWLQLKTDTARAHFDEALVLHEAAGRVGAAARLAVDLAAIDVFELNYEAALARVETAFATLSAQRNIEDPASEADLAVVAAELARRLYLMRASPDVALERVELALEIAERYGLWEQFCEAINTKGLIMGGRGRHAEALALLECALERSTALKLHAAMLRAYNNLAASSQEFDLVRAEALASEGAALARLVGDRRSEITGTVGQVPILVDLGRWDEAIAIEAEFDAMAGEGVAKSEVPRELLYAVWAHLWRGDVAAAGSLRDRLAFLFERTNPEYNDLSRAAEAAMARAAGDNATALQVCSPVVNRARHSTDELYVLRWVLHEATEAAFAVNDLAAVERVIDVVARQYRRGLGPALDGTVSLAAARLAAAEGRVDDEAEHAREAADLFDGMHMPFWVAVVQLHHGEFLASQGHPVEAEDQLARAATTFERLRAVPWLDRVHGARQTHGLRAESEAALPA